MKTNLLCGVICGSFLLALRASAGSVPFDPSSYNFQLAGGGGGAQATLNGATVEIFCDDFANTIWVPSSNSANVTVLTSSLDQTRFGGVTSWTTINSAGATDDAFFNTGAGSAATARYDMVAYLVSQYQRGLGNNTSNNQIQEAIWTLMDPAVYATDTPPIPLINPDGVDPAADLQLAAAWYMGGGATASFLANFEVVTDATMTLGSPATGGVGVGGFQEQIVMTPEPRGGAWMLIGLFAAIGVFQLRRSLFGVHDAR